MKIIPAIDIYRGRIVRLIGGRIQDIIVYRDYSDPYTTACRWVDEGANTLHIVDFDGVFHGRNNLNLVSKICRELNVEVNYGGGLRSLNIIEEALNTGVDRVIIGTLALENPRLIGYLIDEYGYDRVIIALDYDYDGSILIHGWKIKMDLNIIDAIAKYSSMGCKLFLATCRARDGKLSGPELYWLKRVSNMGDIIAGGGVRNLDDIRLLSSFRLYGVVIGRALYEGLISLKDALKVVG